MKKQNTGLETRNRSTYRLFRFIPFQEMIMTFRLCRVYLKNILDVVVCTLSKTISCDRLKRTPYRRYGRIA